MREAYNILCINEVLKADHQKIPKKGLVCVLDFPRNFKIDGINIILRRVHDMKLWLENGLVKITKEMIHQVISYPIITRKKTMRCQSKEVIQENTLAVWNKKGMTISITYP